MINLRERFGKQYKVVYEESYRADRGDGARLPDPGLLTIPCRFGHLYPWDDERLAVSVDGHPGIARRIRQLPGCQVWQDGDRGELTALLPVTSFSQIAQIMHPKRRRQVSDAERARLRAVGFKKGA